MTNLNMAVRLDALNFIDILVGLYQTKRVHTLLLIDIVLCQKPTAKCHVASLSIQMDFVPELVVGGFLAPCLLHFCDLLSQASQSQKGYQDSLTVTVTR